MTEFEYLALVVGHFGTFLSILCAVSLLYYLFLRGKIVSVFDPLLISFTASAIGFTTVVLLYVTATINAQYFLSYLATQAAFMFGFLWAYSPTSSSGRGGIFALLPSASAASVLWVVLPIYLLASVIFYAKFGIPLFSDVSRLDSYYQSDILSSLLNKVYNPTGIIAATLGVSCFESNSLEVRVMARISLVMVAGNVLLSGSKGALLVLVGVIYYCQLYFRSSNTPFPRRLGKLMTAYAFLLVATVFAVFMLVAWVRYDVAPLTILVARIVESGDIYYLAYPNHVLDNIHSSGILVALFPGWGSLFGVDEKALPLGVQIFEYVMGFQRLEAPNARHNVFGLVHLGYVLSVLYSWLIGYLLGLARFKLLLYTKERVAGLVYFVGVTFALSGIESDTGLAISNLLGTVICGTVYLLLGAMLEGAFYTPARCDSQGLRSGD